MPNTVSPDNGQGNDLDLILDATATAYISMAGRDRGATSPAQSAHIAARAVEASPSGSAGANHSGTITAGGTAQNAIAANGLRNYFLLINDDASEDLWFDWTAAAVAASPSIKLGPGERFESSPIWVPTGAISVIAATTSHAFTAKEG